MLMIMKQAASKLRHVWECDDLMIDLELVALQLLNDDGRSLCAVGSGRNHSFLSNKSPIGGNLDLIYCWWWLGK